MQREHDLLQTTMAYITRLRRTQRLGLQKSTVLVVFIATVRLMYVPPDELTAAITQHLASR